MGCISCPQNGVHFLGSFSGAGSCKAIAFFRWANAAVTADSVVVGMDECSLSFFIDGCSGTICRSVQAGARAGLSLRRGRCAYVASVSSNFDLNVALPQLLIGNKGQFPTKFLNEAKSLIGDRLHLIRSHTAWNSVDIMEKYLGLLHTAWCATCPHKPLVLFLDCASCHLHDRVRISARSLGIRIIPIPTHMTGYLQVLDCYVFKRLRDELRSRWVMAQSVRQPAPFDKLAWLQLVADCIDSVVKSHHWEYAFVKTGALGDQSHLSTRLLTALSWSKCPKIAVGPPAIGQASCLFPSKPSRNVGAWVNWSDCAVVYPSFVQTLD